MQEYHECGSTKEGDPQTVAWKYYVLHVLGHEVGGEFDAHGLEDDDASAYFRANLSIASNFAWFRRLKWGQGSKGNPIPGNQVAQCYDTDIPVNDWWDEGGDDARAKANLPLSHRWFDTTDEANSPEGIAETVYRDGDHNDCDPPFHFVAYGVDTNFFSQHDAARCAKKTDWGWITILDEFYPESRTSKGWQLKDVWKPDFDKATARTASDGKVGINWEGTGIWHSTVYRCTPSNSDAPPVCSQVIFDKGFTTSCECIKTFVKDDARRGTTYKIRIDNPGGDKITYVTY